MKCVIYVEKPPTVLIIVMFVVCIEVGCVIVVTAKFLMTK